MPPYLTLFVLLTLTSFSASALEPVTLQLKWHHQFQFAGYYAAKMQGYYEHVGLDVSILPATPLTDPVSQVVEDSAQYGVGSSNILIERHAGKPIVALAVIFQHSPYILLSKKGEINSVHDLIGKRIMLEVQTEELLAYLKREGVPIEELTFVPHSFNSRALIDGEVDVMSSYSTDEPYFLTQNNIPYQSFTPRSTGIDFYGDNLFTSEHELQQHPERVKAFREASLQGWKYALAHPDEIIEHILLNYTTDKTRDQLHFEANMMKSLIQPELIEVGYMLEGRWQHIAATYAELDMLPETVDLDGFLYDANPKIDLAFYYWLIAIVSLISLIVSLIAWYFLRLNKSLDNLLYLKSQQENIGETINNISHQWKQPLNNIGFQLMRIEHIVKYEDDSRNEVLSLVERGQDTIQFMADTVETFQHFLSTKRLISHFSPEVVIEQTLQLLHDNFELNGISVAKQFTNNAKIKGNNTEFAHIILSILINARDIIQQRNITEAKITISTRLEGGRVEIVLADNAGGIDTKPIKKIFKMGTSSKSDSDAGLGLFIAHKIVNKGFSGTVVARNNQQGAEFIIRLPSTN